jgi:hypothetical protein
MTDACAVKRDDDGRAERAANREFGDVEAAVEADVVVHRLEGQDPARGLARAEQSDWRAPSGRRSRARLQRNARRAGRAQGTPADRRRRRSARLRPAFRREQPDLRRWGWLASRAANALWDHASCLAISGRVVRLARDAGALESLAVADNAYGQAAVFAGDFATAASLAIEVETLRDATGTLIPIPRCDDAGRVPRARARGDRPVDARDRRGNRRRSGHGRPVRTVGDGRAHERARPLRGGPCVGSTGGRRGAGALHLGVGDQRARRSRRADAPA